MDPVLESYHALEEKIKQYNHNLDTKRLYAAFQYADQAHSGQLRKDGSPYITRPRPAGPGGGHRPPSGPGRLPDLRYQGARHADHGLPGGPG